MERIVSELVRYPWLAIRVAYSIEHSCQPITDEYFTRREPLVYVECQNFELERYIYIYIYARYSSRRKKSGKFSGRKRRNESSFLGSRDKSYSRTSNG